jgi:hypothetical protein
LFLSRPRLKYIFNKRILNLQALYLLLPFLAANRPISSDWPIVWTRLPDGLE